MPLSSLLDKFNEPETLKMARLGRELRNQGLDIIDLSLGEPDFDTPEHIKEAAIEAIKSNWSHYTPVAGFAELREAICFKLKRDNNLDYKTENIIVSTGAKQSIANAVLALVEAGSEVIVPTPYWVTYSEIVRLAGGTVRFVPTLLEDGYKITPQQLEEAITEQTRLFIFSSPCNPTGAVYSRSELQQLAEVFARHPHVYILSDEIYEYINYNGNHESIAQFENVKPQVIIVNGLSKGFAMTGYRLGYMAASPEVAKACEKLQGQFTSGTNAVTQRAAITALTGSLKATKMMTAEFSRRRQRALELIKEVPGFKCASPDGAFYIFPRVEALFGKTFNGTLINTADDLSMYLLQHAHVSTVTGRAFGEDKSLRLSFANSMNNIETGFSRIKNALLHPA